MPSPPTIPTDEKPGSSPVVHDDAPRIAIGRRCLPSSEDPGPLLRRYHRDRDPADLDQLVRRFRPLTRKLALRYARGSDPVEDLEQVAALGLIKALDRFDPGRGFAFTSFAVPTILGELRRFFRDTGWDVRVPRALQERAAELRVATDEFTSRHGRTPRVSELARGARLTEEEVLEGLHAAGAMSALSLDAPTPSDEDGHGIIDRLGAEDDDLVLVLDRAAVATALSTLTDRQREVVALRFGAELKQSDIAQELGVSAMQVSRTLRATIERLSVLANHQSSAKLQPDGRTTIARRTASRQEAPARAPD